MSGSNLRWHAVWDRVEMVAPAAHVVRGPGLRGCAARRLHGQITAVGRGPFVLRSEEGPVSGGSAFEGCGDANTGDVWVEESKVLCHGGVGTARLDIGEELGGRVDALCTKRGPFVEIGAVKDGHFDEVPGQ